MATLNQPVALQLPPSISLQSFPCSVAAHAMSGSPRHLLLDSQVMRSLQTAPALTPKTHALTCQEILDTLSLMQPVPYLKPDNQKTNLIIRSLADNPMHECLFSPSQPGSHHLHKKALTCSSMGTLRRVQAAEGGREEGGG